MKTYQFDILLDDVANANATAMDKLDDLFEAGCDDCTMSSRNGLVTIHFDRLSVSLEEAISTAIKQVTIVGYTIDKIVLCTDFSY